MSNKSTTLPVARPAGTSPAPPDTPRCPASRVSRPAGASGRGGVCPDPLPAVPPAETTPVAASGLSAAALAAAALARLDPQHDAVAEQYDPVAIYHSAISRVYGVDPHPRQRKGIAEAMVRVLRVCQARGWDVPTYVEAQMTALKPRLAGRSYRDRSGRLRPLTFQPNMLTSAAAEGRYHAAASKIERRNGVAGRAALLPGSPLHDFLHEVIDTETDILRLYLRARLDDPDAAWRDAVDRACPGAAWRDARRGRLPACAPRHWRGDLARAVALEALRVVLDEAMPGLSAHVGCAYPYSPADVARLVGTVLNPSTLAPVVSSGRGQSWTSRSAALTGNATPSLSSGIFLPACSTRRGSRFDPPR